MRKDYKAIRIEVPEELYERFKKQAKNNYKNPTSLMRDYIVKYVMDNEKKNRE